MTEPKHLPQDAVAPFHSYVHVTSDGEGTLSILARGFTTIRACMDCGVLIAGGPTRCVPCAANAVSPLMKEKLMQNKELGEARGTASGGESHEPAKEPAGDSLPQSEKEPAEQAAPRGASIGLRLNWYGRADGLWNADCGCGATLCGYEAENRFHAEAWHMQQAALEGRNVRCDPLAATSGTALQAPLSPSAPPAPDLLRENARLREEAVDAEGAFAEQQAESLRAWAAYDAEKQKAATLERRLSEGVKELDDATVALCGHAQPLVPRTVIEQWLAPIRVKLAAPSGDAPQAAPPDAELTRARAAHLENATLLAKAEGHAESMQRAAESSSRHYLGLAELNTRLTSGLRVAAEALGLLGDDAQIASGYTANTKLRAALQVTAKCARAAKADALEYLILAPPPPPAPASENEETWRRFLALHAVGCQCEECLPPGPAAPPAPAKEGK